ncbi:hypothetical protein GCM10009838_32750 [Catenulispora subtropica]|uniref:Uncharacterized protein n=1 Tax=Catenulispora subtropica TaxID=450798 RepID=A0ABN2RKY0_9ACTN
MPTALIRGGRHRLLVQERVRAPSEAQAPAPDGMRTMERPRLGADTTRTTECGAAAIRIMVVCGARAKRAFPPAA